MSAQTYICLILGATFNDPVITILFLILNTASNHFLVSYFHPDKNIAISSASFLDYIPTPGFGCEALIYFLPEVVLALAVSLLLLVASVEIARGEERKLLAIAC